MHCNWAQIGKNRLLITLALVLILLMGQGIWTSSAFAVETDSVSTSVTSAADRLYAALQEQNRMEAEPAFKAVKKWWTLNKAQVKSNSLELALEIDKHIAALSLALLTEDDSNATDAAAELSFSLHAYEDGAYANTDQDIEFPLSAYITQLQLAKGLADKQDWAGAGKLVKQLQNRWLSVEGEVVSRSQTVYNHTERDLVLVDAYLTNENQRPQAAAVLERMAQSLSPLAQKGYSWWDAALIPFREGLEAVLVISALSVAAERSNSRRAKRWIVGGTSAGIILCIAAGLVVAMLISTAAIGSGNSQLNGWTGIVSSVLLLYVSYWLHRNADIQRWNHFLKGQTSKAASSGHALGFGLLAFFAIVREGLETVLFLVGLAGKMPTGTIIAGLAAGFGLLVIVALLMRLAGSKIPVRPLFIASSLVVFYLCFKFLGSGIHSLQMAGVIPSSVSDYLPQLASISLYPSWYSTFPQLVLVLLALAALLPKGFRRVGNTQHSI
ncbi:high-affinity iron transporter [Paenibacillaceae bacterium GAS479]|nr:high-affinity iron transporter [Paenibacillaceae bacterium GAS479]